MVRNSLVVLHLGLLVFEILPSFCSHVIAPYTFQAERQLNEAQKIPGHSLQVLQLVANANAAEADVRQAAAIHFKNVVKNGWNTEVSVKLFLVPTKDPTL